MREAERIEYEGVPAKIFRAEHIVAIAASVGRAKDKARIEQMLQQADLDKTRLEKILQRHKIKMPLMKLEMRRKLASEPFVEKIRKVAQLIQLAKTFPRRASRPPANRAAR